MLLQPMMARTVSTFLLVCCWGLSPGQVAHDACESAHDLGVFDGFPTVCFDGIGIWEQCIVDSNTLATGGFPYYSLTNCTGYTGSTAVPANDVWYRFEATTVAWFQVTNDSMNPIDTLHLSFYLGDDCNQLFALACFTIDLVNNNAFQDTLWLGDVSQGDSIYMQVSGNGLGQTGAYRINMRGCLFCPNEPASYDPVDPACFAYTVNAVDASAVSAQDGSATVAITNGTGPYTFQWSDDPGVSDSARTNLAPGVYGITVTNGQGCSEVDSAVVGPIPPVGVASISSSTTLRLGPNPSAGNLRIWLPEVMQIGQHVLLELHDVTGRLLERQPVVIARQHTISWNLAHLQSGTYLLQLTTPDGAVRTARWVKR